MIAPLLAAAALAMPMPPAGPATVTIPGRLFVPADLQVLVGQTVTWDNEDASTHNIHADDGSFDSGHLDPHMTYSYTFSQPGTYTYLCTIHRSMRGQITVSALGLTGPSAPVRAGRTATLDVVAPPGTPLVGLERLQGAGPAVHVADAVPDAGGHASFTVPATAPARYRARIGALTSAAVPVHVAPAVTAVARRAGRTVTVTATTSPAQPKALAVLGAYVRERFDYLPVQQGRLDGASRITFRLRSARRLRLRVRLMRPVGGYSMADSAPVVVPRLRR